MGRDGEFLKNPHALHVQVYIESRCGTRQGCPLGAQLFALGLHPLLCRLQALVDDRGVVISYADDLHIIAPPSVVSEALLALTATASPTHARFDACILELVFES